MKFEIEVKKTLVTDNNKKFGIHSDIAFTLLNKTTQNEEKYIGRIIEIDGDSIVIDTIECKNKDVEVLDKMRVLLNSIVDNSCSYVYYD